MLQIYLYNDIIKWKIAICHLMTSLHWPDVFGTLGMIVLSACTILNKKNVICSALKYMQQCNNGNLEICYYAQGQEARADPSHCACAGQTLLDCENLSVGKVARI